DIQDNPGAGGTSDTVGLLRALIAHRAKGAVIGMIVDPEAAERAMALGEGALLDCGVGAKVGYAGETPVEADWRIMRLGTGRFTGTGPMYGGAKFQIGPMALVTDEASGVSAVLASKRIQANDKETFRHVGEEPFLLCPNLERDVEIHAVLRQDVVVFRIRHQAVRDLAGEARVDAVIAWRDAGRHRHRAELRRAQPDDGMLGAGQKALPPKC